MYVYIYVYTSSYMCVYTHLNMQLQMCLGRIGTFKSLAIKFVLSDFMVFNVNIV